MRPAQKGPLAGSVVNMTKKQQQMFKAVHESEYTSLYDVYVSFSVNKRRAFDYCLYEMHQKNGFYFRITSANCHFFTCGFLYYDDDKHLRCRYYTGRNTYDFIAE